MPRRKQGTGQISVFKGREAKLNCAIFQVLAFRGPLTIYSIYKHLKIQRNLEYTRYATVNKRVKNLEEFEFIEKTGTRKTKAGFVSFLYDVTTKAYLAVFLNSITFDEIIVQTSKTTAPAMLGSIAYVINLKPEKSKQ